MDEFNDIKIAGIDTKRPPRVDLDTEFVNVFFQLSHNAPKEWCQFFNATLDKSEVQAFIDAKDGRFIESISLPDRLPLQLDFLKTCVDKCNSAYRGHLDEVVKRNKQEKEVKKKKQDKLQTIIAQLSFD